MTAPGRPNSPLGRVSPVFGFTDGGDEGGTIPAHYTGTTEALAYGHDPASDLDANDGQVRLVVRLDPGQTLIMNPEPVVIVRDRAAHDRKIAAKAWDEGWDACTEYVDSPDWGQAPPNPYLEGDDQ